jgi:hypothetical protein
MSNVGTLTIQAQGDIKTCYAMKCDAIGKEDCPITVPEVYYNATYHILITSFIPRSHVLGNAIKALE